MNKSLGYLDNQNKPLTTAEEVLDYDNFFIGAIFDISNEFKKNKSTKSPRRQTPSGQSHSVPKDQHLLQSRLWCTNQSNSRRPD